VGKTTLLRQQSQQTHYYYRTANKPAKGYHSCCTFNKISIKRKRNCAARTFDPIIHFDVMINFDFFDLTNWDSLMA